MSNYYIRLYSDHEYNHGGIGYVDAEKIMDRAGYEALTIPGSQSRSLTGKLSRLLAVHRLAKSISAESTIVFLYPVYSKMHWLLARLLRRKGCQMICVVMDIDGLKDANKKQLQHDIRSFRGFRQFIVHNPAMDEWLRKQVAEPQTALLNFFDFLAKPASPARQSNTVVFAGNLAKSKFLWKLPAMERLQLNLYGELPEAISLPSYATWKGR